MDAISTAGLISRPVDSDQTVKSAVSLRGSPHARNVDVPICREKRPLGPLPYHGCVLPAELRRPGARILLPRRPRRRLVESPGTTWSPHVTPCFVRLTPSRHSGGDGRSPPRDLPTPRRLAAQLREEGIALLGFGRGSGRDPALGLLQMIKPVHLDLAGGHPGEHPVAVLSYSYWKSRLAANPAVIGSTILVNIG